MMEHLNDVERGKTIHVNGVLFRVGNKSGEMTEVQNKETKELKAWPSRMMVEVVHNMPQEDVSDWPHTLQNPYPMTPVDVPKRENVIESPNVFINGL